MLDKDLIEIINEWDPIRLFPIAPKNEYFAEILQIQEFIDSQKTLDPIGLANRINDIFVKSFGSDIYKVKHEKILAVTQEIVDKVWSHNIGES